MTPIPHPRINKAVERELWRLLQKGFEVNRWRPDFEEWSQKRLWSELHQERLLTKLERLTGPVAGKQVLDLGCGRGGLSVALNFAGATATAIDLRRRNLRILRLRASRYDMIVPSARCVGESLPFRNQVFDLVVCKDVTEHCRNPRELLSDIARILAPGGKAYVTFINRFAWIDPHYRIRGINYVPRPVAEWIIRWRGRTKPNIRDLQRLSDMHYFTRAAAHKLARECGLQYHDVTAAHQTRSMESGHVPFGKATAYGVGTLESLLSAG